MRVKTCINYESKDLPGSYRACLWFLLLYMNYPCTVWLFFWVVQIFADFISVIIYEISYTWCLRYIICSAWFLDIKISTCYQCNLIFTGINADVTLRRDLLFTQNEALPVCWNNIMPCGYIQILYPSSYVLVEQNCTNQADQQGIILMIKIHSQEYLILCGQTTFLC